MFENQSTAGEESGQEEENEIEDNPLEGDMSYRHDGSQRGHAMRVNDEQAHRQSMNMMQANVGLGSTTRGSFSRTWCLQGVHG